MVDPLRYTFKTTPYPHQLRALEKLRKLSGQALLACPMRSGKSKIAIDWSAIAYHNLGLRRVLVVCPLSVVGVWQDEIARHLPIPSRVNLLRDSAKKNSETVKALDEFAGITFMIVNYDMLWRPVTEVGSRGGEHKVHLDQVIARWKPDLVIADEAHRLKNPTSRQSQALGRLGAASRMRLALTGTPVTRSPLDLYGEFRFIDPTVFANGDGTPMTNAQFKDYYADWQPARYEPRIKEVVRYKNLDELVARVRAHSFRIQLKDVADLPEKTYTTIHTPLGTQAKRIYRDMATEMIAWLDGRDTPATADIVLVKLMRLSQITSGFIKDEAGVEVDVDDAKLRALLDLVNDMLAQDEKVVVFCRFKHDYHRISEALTAQRTGFRSLTGETPQPERAGNIRDFQTDPSVSVFVSQTQAGSLGIDLSAARLAVFYSLDYNWATYVQAQDRILSIKNPRPLGIYHLVAPGTVDALVLRVLRERGDLAHALLHDPSKLLQ